MKSHSTLSPSPSSFRPKAKINSSATIGRKPSSSSSIVSANGSTASTTGTPRSRSPFKSNVGLTPTSAVKARVTIHQNPKSNTITSSPEPRQRSFTAVASDASEANHERQRSGSFSFHHEFSSSSLGISPTSPTTSSSSQNPQLGLQPIKVKSKVSRLAKSNSADTTSPVSPLSSPRLTHSRSRVPSISASHIQFSKPPSPAPPEQQFYPITTAVPAASPYRFVTTRQNNNQHHRYQPILPNDDHFVTHSKRSQADPTVIPLPPQSPPTSALSFSSHSSLSYNTETSAENLRTFSALGLRTNQQRQGHGRALSVRSSLDGPVDGAIPRVDLPMNQDDHFEGGETEDDSEGSERKVKAEAKTNRKVFYHRILNHIAFIFRRCIKHRLRTWRSLIVLCLP